MPTRSARVFLAAWAALAAAHTMAAPLRAQETLYWPLRTHAGAEALAPGAAAPFWNAAGLAEPPARAALLVVDSRSPSAIGLTGFAAAGVLRVRHDTHVGAGFRHVGIDGIDRTTDSPLPEPGGDALEAAEDRVHLAAAWTARPGTTVGVGVRWTRASELLGGDVDTGVSLGARWRPALPLAPELAGTLARERGVGSWSAALRLTAPLPESLADWGLQGEYGVRHTPAADARTQRALLSAAWQDRVTLALGAAGEPDGAATGWHLVAGGSVSLSRYTLGLVREALAGGFGAAHTFRLQVHFQ